MNVHSQEFSKMTNTQPFHDHIATQTIILTYSFVSSITAQWQLPGDLNNECAELRLPKCHCQMVFQDHIASQIIVLTQSSVSQENCSKLSPRRTGQTSILQET